MPRENRKLTRAIRERMERTGETYSTARMHLLASLGGEAEATPPPKLRSAPLSGLAAQVQVVLDAHPDLTYFGFRAPGGEVSRVRDRAKFNEERAQLLREDGVQQVERCLAYLALVRKTRSATPTEDQMGRGSYGMKHEVEAWLSTTGGTDRASYIANGAFIVAALIAGFPIHREDPSSLNCSVGVEQEDVRAIQEGKDPRDWQKTTEFVAWLFEQAGREDDVGRLGADCKRDFSFPRTGDVSTIRAYLSRYGTPVQEWFKIARAEYRAASEGVKGSMAQCKSCGLSYAPDQAADRTRHRRIHEALDDLERIHGRRPDHWADREGAKSRAYELRRAAKSDEERLVAMEMICRAHFDRSIFPTGDSAASVKQTMRHPDFATYAGAYDAEGIFGDHAPIFRRKYPHAPRPELQPGMTHWDFSAATPRRDARGRRAITGDRIPDAVIALSDR